MKTFLAELAEKIYKEHSSWDDVTLVFPNRRAIIYFRKHLTDLLDKPAFAPEFLTIEEFIGSFSGLKVPDKLELVYRLYQSYYEVVGSRKESGQEPESFDRFYFWGDMLLRDFEEVDKYLVQAPQLFRDLSSQKELDAGFDFLDEEQKNFLKEFWGNFSEDLTANKKKFLHVWRLLPEVYAHYKKQLENEGLAYEGMLHRAVAESGLKNSTGKKLIFAGFNALTLAEEKIISTFVNNEDAKVYWDLDQYYVHDNTQESGRFFRQYQEDSVLGKTFEPDLPANFRRQKSVRVIGSAQQVGQTKAMTQILKEQLAKGIHPEETLIVLPDEKLLLPVLHGVSDSVEKLNVTMGFPLASTPMFNLIEFLVELQLTRRGPDFNHRHILSILGHPYILALDPGLAGKTRWEIIRNNKIMVPAEELAPKHPLYGRIFSLIKEGSLISYLREAIVSVGALPNINPLDKEYAFHFLKLINRFEEVVAAPAVTGKSDKENEKQFQESLKSFMRLFRQLVRSQKIPFTGEPLKGLQVMGVLETRNLDYKNVFILSLNEGALPSSGNKPSYIPYNIRKAYGLPTPEHQDAFYAYLFYRSFQRAENVFLFYNTETDVLGQGEMSRYLQQILFESGWNPKPVPEILHNVIQPHPSQSIEIKKDDEVMKSLLRMNEITEKTRGISPSLLSTYIQCGLQFYLKYVARIREATEVEDEIDARLLGSFLHAVMEKFYMTLIRKKGSPVIEASDLTNVKAEVDQLIDDEFRKNHGNQSGSMTYKGQEVVVREILRSFAMKIVSKDREYVPFKIEGLELKELTYTIPISKKPGKVNISGTIDRVDSKDNSFRVVDYKTGRDKTDFKSIADLFEGDKNFNKAAFQTFLYTLLYKANSEMTSANFTPGLYSRGNLFSGEGFSLTMDKRKLGDTAPLLAEFEERLADMLNDLFDPATSFTQTAHTENCTYCSFKAICYR